ncbi:MAG: FG-GAP repeat domain-containing protein [Planctomycetota bacterium]|jgi:hypothetical protein
MSIAVPNLFNRRGLSIMALLFATNAAQAQQFMEETSTRFPQPNPTDYTNQLTIGDIDGDDDLDIIWANGGGFSSQQAPEIIRVYVNNGDGTFFDNSENSHGNTTGWLRGVELGDIDNDGDLDLIGAQDFNRLPKLMLNNGTGRFESQEGVRLPQITLASSRAQFGDIDNDGDLDIFITSGTTTRFSCGQYRVYINDGEGFFTDETSTHFPTGNVCNNMDCIFGDIDNDFDIDIKTASTGNNNSRLYKNDGNGVFTQVSMPPDSSCYSYDFGDIDGDGDLDLFGANGLSGSNADVLYRNDGTGTFTNIAGNVSPNPSLDDNDSKFFDFDDDGDLDLLVGRLGSGGERLYRNNGTGVFTQTSGVMQIISDSTLDIMVADMDGDGRFDIVTAQGESGNFQNRIYMNNGPQDTRAPRIIDTEQHPDTIEPGPYVVRALILDDMTSDRNFFDKGIFVNYTVNEGPEQSVEMRYSGGQVYRGEIPNQPGEVTIAYYVSATDFNDNTAIGDTLSFTAEGGDVPGGPLAEDSLSTACTDDSECPNESVCSLDSGVCYVPKNRYLSVDANSANAGISTARRIRLGNGADNPVLGWIGEPGGDIAGVADDPYYADWTTLGLVHIGDCEISPDQAYLVQNIAEGADIANEAIYSTALSLSTVAVFGDVKGGAGSPPNGVANFEDIQEVVFGFQNTSSLPDVWLDLDGEVPNQTLNFADVQMSVFGFQTVGYPFSAPLDCN